MASTESKSSKILFSLKDEETAKGEMKAYIKKASTIVCSKQFTFPSKTVFRDITGICLSFAAVPTVEEKRKKNKSRKCKNIFHNYVK